jgi:T5SS/PEP-CTERM-associated repeat protein
MRRAHHLASIRRHAVAIAVGALAATYLPTQAQAQAPYFSFSGAVNTYPSNKFPVDVNSATLDLTGTVMNIGQTFSGSFAALAGAQLQVDALTIGNAGTGEGRFTATGPGTLVQLGGTGNRMQVGSWGVGILDVLSGARVDGTFSAGTCSAGGFYCGSGIGTTAGATGTVNIVGTNSELRLIGGLQIGGAYVNTGYGTQGGVGAGNLNISAGGSLRSSGAYLGYGSGALNDGSETSVALVGIDGTGSQWLITSDATNHLDANLSIGSGKQSSSTVLVSNGGLLRIDATGGAANSGYVFIGSNGGAGALTVRGANSSLQLIGGAAEILLVGKGSFSALAGAQVAANALKVGVEAGALATAVVTGVGTVATLNGPSSRLLIGQMGSGTMMVSDGALVDAGGSLADCAPGNTWCGSEIAGSAGSGGVLTVTGNGSAVRLTDLGVGSVWSDGGYGTPGADSHGTVQVLSGGTLRTMGVTLGGGQGSPLGTGTEKSITTVTIDGAGSQWIATRDTIFGGQAYFTIGQGAHATSSLTVSNSGKLVLDATGAPAGSFSSMTVGSGGGTGTLTAQTGGMVQLIGATLLLGADSGSSGTLNLLSGGQLQAGGLRIGDWAGSTGTATVSGPLSAAVLDGSGGRLTIGSQGVGVLAVLDGGLVDAATNLAACTGPGLWCGAEVGATAGSTGTLTVSGAGSEVRTGYLNVANANAFGGNYGTPGGTSRGTVSVMDGGMLKTQSVSFGVNYGGVGNPGNAQNGTEKSVASAVIDGAGSQWVVADPASGYGAGFTIGSGKGVTAGVTVSNGGTLAIHGDGRWSSLNIGNDGAFGSLDVLSGGSVLGGGSMEDHGASAYINLGNGSGSSGTLRVLSGGQVRALSLTAGNGQGSSGTVLVSGIGSAMGLVGTNGRLNIANQGTGTVTVADGGLLDGTINFTACSAPGAWCGSSIANSAGAIGTLTVTGAGSLVKLGSLNVGSGYAGTNYGLPGGTSQGTVQVLAGGTLNTQTVNFGQTSSGPASTGTEKVIASATIDGAGSLWTITPNTTNGGAAGMGAGIGSNAKATLTVSAGGRLVIDGRTGTGPNDYLNLGSTGGSADLTVTGKGSSVDLLWVDPVLQVGRNGAGNSSFSVLAGASASVLYLNVARDGANGSLTIDGAGSALNQVGIGIANAGNNGSAAFARIGRNGGTGTVTVSNGGSWLISDGGGDTHTTGGPGILIGQDAGTGSSGQLIIDGAGSTVQVLSASRAPAPGALDSFNPTVWVGYDDVTKAALTVRNGGQLLLTGNALSTVANPSLTGLRIGARSAGVTSSGTATVTGAGSQIVLSGSSNAVYVGMGAGSTGTLDVRDHGMVASTSLIVGDRGGNGRVLLDNASIALAGYRSDLTNQGAGTTIGRGTGGNGLLTLSHGAQLTVQNDTAAGGLSVGGDRYYGGGTGTVTLSGGSSIQLLGTVAGGVTVGYSGTGTMTLSDASTLNAGASGGVFVGRNAGSVGLLSLSGGSSVSASYVGVGAYRSGGASFDGGNGVLTLDNSSLTANVLEIGAHGVVLGDHGVIHANVINRGVFHPDPPGVPGTLVIDGSFQNVDGGQLVLDIAADGHGGYTTSHLVFTQGSVYDFSKLKVSFDFLGNTDPNAFLASGGFKLDTFLQARAADGSDSGLSTTFTGGASYASVFGSSQFSATADAYAINNFAFTPDASASFTAAPVPEPTTVLLLLAGLATIGWRARRRDFLLAELRDATHGSAIEAEGL